MTDADDLTAAVDLAVGVIRGADPARYGDPTPCSDYTVADVVNHLAFGFLLAHHSAIREPWSPEWSAADRAPFLRDLPEPGWAEAAAKEGAATAGAWADPAVWEGDSHMGGAPMPAAAIGALMTGEFLVHAWDLAVATGQTYTVPAELGEVALEAMSGMASMGRDAGWIGPEVPVPAAAPAFDRALGVSGRDPRWTA
ncbi:TIGR03086 family metal-binding protein [Pseudonocardia pini]|uniref:TIGR03086 family metal-binding protein n=1 Tax=Pseudonocardia pini TaxID=2758030 RepID=UPI0015F0FBF6|nr:TIGR03086 family metal-binding protein [Pseudonocardia pini]